MKTYLRFLITMIVVAGSLGISFAQDTLIVEPDLDIEQGALNQAILGDTTATGERNNLNRVYKLRRGGFYILDGQIIAQGYDVRLYGEPVDPNDPTLPPAYIIGGVDEEGQPTPEIGQETFKVSGDFEARNIYFGLVSLSGAHTRGVIMVNKDSVTVTLDNCIVEYTDLWTGRMQASYTKLFVTNCLIKNCGNVNTQYYFGIGFHHRGKAQDTLWVENNTWMNNNGFCSSIASRGQIVNFEWFNHNTIVNQMKFVRLGEWQTESHVLNNIFYNPHISGESPSSILGQDPDGLVYGAMTVDTVAADVIDTWGITEADRVYEIRNNTYYVDQRIHDMWEANDTVAAEPFLNSRAQAMFDDDATWPGLVLENLYDEVPLFTNLPDKVPDAILYVNDFYAVPQVSPQHNWLNYDADGDELQPGWPLTEDLSYSNEALMTAGTDGFPVGDLNWFPELKAQWEAQGGTPTSIEVNRDEIQVIKDFTLNQNYPNPFNPNTIIEFTVPSTGHVKLSVYNMLGEEVATLVNGVLSAQAYRVKFDGNNLSSGIYLYKLSSNNVSITRKMMLLK